MKKLTLADIKNPIEEKELDFKELHKKHLIDPRKKIEHQPIAISCGYKFETYVPLVTYGNFACIVGASKSMKSFLKTALNSCYIGGNSTHHFDFIKGHNTDKKFIIDCDTEQSDFHVNKSANRVIEMVGNYYEYYKPFALRPLEARERVQFLEWIIYESEYRTKIGLLSIDGVADLVNNVNDLEESNKIVQKLMKWTEENKIAGLTVLHKNYESDKPTGHLGSAVLKKSETVVFVNKKGDIVEVEPRYTRNIPFDGFSFSLDNGIPKSNGILF